MKTRDAAILGLALLACQPQNNPAASANGPSTPGGAAGPSAPAAASTPEASRLAEHRTLALSDPGPPDRIDARLKEFSEAARALPKKPESWVLLGQAWVLKARQSGDSGYYLNAKACAELAFALAPDFQLAQHLQLLVLQNEHSFEAARTLALRLTSSNPGDFMAQGALSDAELELGHIPEAEAAAQRMMDLKPSLPAYARLAHLRFVAGDINGAKEAFRLAFDAGRGAPDPEPAAWTLVQAATLFWHVGDYEGTKAGLDFVATSFPSLGAYAPALQLEGRLALSMGQTTSAITALTRSMVVTPSAETAWLLADAHLAAGDGVLAKAAELEVLRLGRQTDARTLSLFLAHRDRDHDEALRAAEQDRKHRGGVYADDALAFALYRAGRAAEALPLVRAMVATGTPDARLLFHAGLVLRAAGLTPNEKREGDDLIRRALKQNPNFDAASVAEAGRLLSGPR